MDKKKKIIVIVIVSIIIILFFALVVGRSREFFSPLSDKKSQNSVPGYANQNDPYIQPFVIQDVLTREQCDKIIEYSRSRLDDSRIMSGKDTRVRNSKQCWIPKNSPMVKGLFDWASGVFKIPVENAEDLQVVRYRPGEYFKEHHDACCDDNKDCQQFIDRSGQRILTILIYLNDQFTDGETYFPNLGIKTKVKPGSAIIFFPTAKNTNQCHPKALHAGLPVSSGEKWVANLWFHERKYQY